jgi:membrane protease YdiL (CAAX protease family)
MAVMETHSEPRFRLKPVPILVTAALGYGLPIVAAYGAFYCSKIFHTPAPNGPLLPWLYMQHGFQLLVALLVIALMKFKLVPADYGLHWPRGKSYLWPAVLWGAFFGVVMTLVDYAPQLMAHTKPDAGFPLTPSNIGGWLFFEGVYVGPTEEIPFRALLVTYLATTMPGRLAIGRFNMRWAGIIVALIFALLHMSSFHTRHWPEALGQQCYAFALGVLYAYWLEKSNSVVAPIVGHNVSDVVEYIILFAWLGVLW